MFLCIYTQDLPFNTPQGLICHTTQLNVFFLHCIRCIHETSIASHCPGICFYINEYLLKCLYTPDKRLKAGLERKKEENETSVSI